MRIQANGNVIGDLFLSLNESTPQDTLLSWIRSGEVSFNSSDQIFLMNVDPDQRILSTVKIWQGETSMIDSVNDLILRLPMNSYLSWDNQQNPEYLFSNEQSAGSMNSNFNVSEDGKSLTLPVDTFPVHDTLYIDNLLFGELTNPDSIHLLLGLHGIGR